MVVAELVGAGSEATGALTPGMAHLLVEVTLAAVPLLCECLTLLFKLVHLGHQSDTVSVGRLKL